MLADNVNGRCPLGTYIYDCTRPIPCGYKRLGEPICEHPSLTKGEAGPEKQEGGK